MRINFILITIMVLPFVGLSQKYVPIRSENSEWIVENLYIDGDSGERSYGKGRYFVKGDTLINDSVFIPVYLESNDDIRIFSYLYQDSIERKIYLTDYPPGYLHLLFDFNLIEGQFFMSTHGSFNYGEVQKVDSIEINNIYRKRIVFKEGIFSASDYQPIYYIEGIGSNAGIIPTDYLGLITSFLTCYREDNEPVYPVELNENGCNMNSIIISNETDIKLPEIQVYPNPFYDKVSIKSGYMKNERLKIHVFNLLGERLLTQKINAENEFHLNLSFLVNGIYIIQIEKDNMRTIEKIIIKRDE